MSSFNRRSFLLFAAASGVTLAGCGFTPTYGQKGTASRFLNNIAVDAPTDQNTYVLVRELEDRLGRVSQGAYGLSVAVKTAEETAAKNISGVITRFDITGEATFALRDIASGEVLTSGKTQNFVSYSASGTTVATLAAETDAYERLMVILTDQIVANLMAYAAQNPS